MMRTILLHALSHIVRSRGQVGGAGGLGATLYRRGVSLLARLAIGGMLAVVAAIVLGAVATGGGLVQLLVTMIAAVALWIPAFLLVSRIARWRRARQERVARAPGTASPRSAEARPALEGTIDSAWNGLALAAGPRQAEVRRLEGQLAAVWQALPSHALDPQAHELQLLIGKRIPQLIETRLACLPVRRAERMAALDDLVDLLRDFTDDSVHRHERLADHGRQQHAAVRRRIEDHLGRDGLSPLT